MRAPAADSTGRPWVTRRVESACVRARRARAPALAEYRRRSLSRDRRHRGSYLGFRPRPSQQPPADRPWLARPAARPELPPFGRRDVDRLVAAVGDEQQAVPAHLERALAEHAPRGVLRLE